MKWLRSLMGDAGKRPSNGPVRNPLRPEGGMTADPLNPDHRLHQPGPERKPTSPHVHTESCDVIMEHIEQWWGPVPCVLHEEESHFVHIDVLPVEPTEARPFWTFVTSGMSDQRMKMPPGEQRNAHVEVMISLPLEWPVPEFGRGDMSAWKDDRAYWPIGLLKWLALFPHRFDTWLSVGHTVTYKDAPCTGADGVAFTDALFLPPVLTEMEGWFLQAAPNKEILFLQVVPLFPEETEYKRIHGWQALGALVRDEDDFELINPARRKLVHDA